MELHIEWDSSKADANRRKHKLSFETASRVFADPLALTKFDRIENGEIRWKTLGAVDGLLVVVVAHTMSVAADGDEVIRIISARRAEPKEKKRYEQDRAF